tara:strand:- start:228 stop:1622 length:1395 start_codon:yes stop_codon:yes gene_type:complete
MAIPKFNIPNLCGASPELNNALSKIADLKDSINVNINLDASAAAEALNSKLADVKAGLDGLAPDLPEIPNVNFQSELTSLVSDFDISTPQGLLDFNLKKIELEGKFGDALTKAGKSFDSLISDATSAVSGGGDVCALAPNLELPAGVTAEEIKEGTAAAVEKAQGVKTALENAKDEAPSVIVANDNAINIQSQTKIQSLLKKIDVKGISGLATDKENADIQKALGAINDGTFKSRMEADIAKAKEEQKKIWQDPLNYKRVVPPAPTVSSVSSSAVKSAQDSGATISQVPVESKKTREVEITSTENRNTVTTTTTTIETKGGGSKTITRPKTEKSTISIKGYAMRRGGIRENFITPSAPERFKTKPKWKLVDEIGSGIELKQMPFTIDYVRGRVYKPDNSYFQYTFNRHPDGDKTGNMIAALVEGSNPPKVVFLPNDIDDPSVLNISALYIKYTALEKIDPNFKG